jgi:type IV pilus assembly protein PilM
MLLDRIKSLIADPPPAVAFEISEAGIAAARISSRAEMEFVPLPPGALAVSPLHENVADPDEFSRAVRSLAGRARGKRRDTALILPDYSTRMAVLDFDSFPSDAREQLSLIRFRLKRSVPFDIESAAVSYFPQPSGHGKRVDVVVAMAPLEIVARYEAPFRSVGLNPGLVTTSGLAALELAQESGLSVMAKLSGRVLTVLVREKVALKLARCVELPSAGLDDIAAVLVPTFVYIEDNLGGRAEKLYLCGFGTLAGEAASQFGAELNVAVEPVRSALGIPGENDAGLLGYLRSIARNN